MSKKKKHHEEHEEHVNHEAWVIPYADMLTLLMALFLVMWATSQVDVNKAREVAAGFADSLNIVGNGQGVGGKGVLEAGPEPNARPELLSGRALSALEESQFRIAADAASAAQLAAVQQQISATATEQGFSSDISFRSEEDGLIVSIVSEGVLFDPGSADLRADGSSVLAQLAGILTSVPNRVAVEGHTDNVPISTARFPSNWELSASRATAVLRYLVEAHGVPAVRISASGFGEHSPVADNATPEGRAKNRRVDIKIVAQATVVTMGDGTLSVTPTTLPINPLGDTSQGDVHSDAHSTPTDHETTQEGSHE